jgi:Fic-DOC domain mobile mystery protein B
MQARIESVLEDGQTPLDPDEAEGLLPKWIGSRGDLNEAENANILSSFGWARSELARGTQVATEGFLRGLHAAMFGEVWAWAGRYRCTERNIGVAPHQISSQLHNLFADAAAWREFNSYPLDEQAIRLHHRLTWIHPFPNGNGRVSRFIVDHYLEQQGSVRFTWGSALPAQEARPLYLQAIRAADGGDFDSLRCFVRR